MTTHSFDFVIVGGGTAGLVLANRLSEHPNQRVLVLEAGSDLTGDLRIITPAFFQILLGSKADWGFQTHPQINLQGRRLSLNQGKALGGSSAINSHVFVPPAQGLVDAWESLGNDGWNWDTLREYYAKAYTSPYVDESSKKSLGIDGWASRDDSARGPIQASFSGNPSHPIREAWARAFKDLGYYMRTDPFLGASVGGFSTMASIHPKTKERSYAASAYYNPIKNRKNLQVYTDAAVEKIIFDNNPLRAIGVQYKQNNKIKTVMATKDVILAAGALQSPKLLELSGVGNATLLQNHGIKVVTDLPQVGENLHDHLGCYMSYEAAEEIETLDALIRQEPEASGKAMKDYAADRYGMLGSLGVYSYAYMPLVQCLSGESRDTLRELLHQHHPKVGEGPDQARAKMYYDIAEETILSPEEPSGTFLLSVSQLPSPIGPNSSSFPEVLPGKWITFSVMLSQPLSRGTVHIGSDQTSTPPVIDPNYLSNPVDLDILARHVQYVETIASSPAFNTVLKQPLRCRDPSVDISDLERAKDYVRTNATSVWHVCGSCAMLPKEKGGVVDTQLGVYGIQNLRVVDASAIPLISTASLQTTVYAFAERAADIIKEIHELK
ncbi:putative GMC oxidoreductase [Jackrogersella minutella]|nr:putative GMC oxidoreductase [Jackrogersella minutella]